MKEYEIRTVTHGTAILLAQTKDDWHWIIVEKYDACQNEKPTPLAWAKWDDDFGFLDVDGLPAIKGKSGFGISLAFGEVERHILETREGTVRGLILGIHSEIRLRMKMLGALTETVARTIESNESYDAGDHAKLSKLFVQISDLRAKLIGISTAIRLKARKTPLRTE